jgi:hypothetical protein
MLLTFFCSTSMGQPLSRRDGESVGAFDRDRRCVLYCICEDPFPVQHPVNTVLI